MKKGFTLAEVLITLGIIGVVAALTMPSLIAKYEKKVTVTKLKKNINILSQAINRAYVANDYTWPDAATMTNVQFYNWIKPYLTIVKDCPNPSVNKCGIDTITCWHGNDNGCGQSTWVASNAPRIVLADGTIVLFAMSNRIIIDVDGPKGKHRVGYDIFAGIEYNNSAMFSTPYVINSGAGSCNPLNDPARGGNNGFYCTGQIIHDGWEIKYR